MMNTGLQKIETTSMASAEILLCSYSQETPERNPEVGNTISRTAEKVNFITADFSIPLSQIGEFSEPDTTFEFELSKRGKGGKNNGKKKKNKERETEKKKTKMEEQRRKHKRKRQTFV